MHGLCIDYAWILTQLIILRFIRHFPSPVRLWYAIEFSSSSTQRQPPSSPSITRSYSNRPETHVGQGSSYLLYTPYALMCCEMRCRYDACFMDFVNVISPDPVLRDNGIQVRYIAKRRESWGDGTSDWLTDSTPYLLLSFWLPILHSLHRTEQRVSPSVWSEGFEYDAAQSQNPNLCFGSVVLLSTQSNLMMADVAVVHCKRRHIGYNQIHSAATLNQRPLLTSTTSSLVAPYHYCQHSEVHLFSFNT